MIKDKNGIVTIKAVADAKGQFSTALTQSIIRPVEWSVGGEEVEILEKNHYQEEILSPYTITVKSKKDVKSKTIVMNGKKLVTLKI